jgi:hypothetical protein
MGRPLSPGLTNDDAVKLAKGLRAGLDAVHAAPKG